MGIFDYTCCINGKNCILIDSDGQDHTDGTIFITDDKRKKKYEAEYSGYGYADSSSDLGVVYDLGHSEYFKDWDVKEDDKRGYFVCIECAKTIETEVDSFDKLWDNKRCLEIMDTCCAIIKKKSSKSCGTQCQNRRNKKYGFFCGVHKNLVCSTIEETPIYLKLNESTVKND